MNDKSRSARCFVPPSVLRWAAAAHKNENSVTSVNLKGCALFTDISGFTALSEKYSRRGSEGIELLTSSLNAYFKSMIRIIENHGGEIIKFAGDAILSILIIEDDETIEHGILRAVGCSLNLHHSLNTIIPSDEIQLHFKTGFEYGAIQFDFIRNGDRSHFLPHGNALEGATLAEKMASSGDVIAGPEAFTILKKSFACETYDIKGYGLIKECQTLSNESDKRISPFIDLPDEELFRYVPSSIKQHLMAGLDDWIVEYRNVSIVFVNVSDYSTEKIMEIIECVEETSDLYDGTVQHIMSDYRGLTIAVVYGLPPIISETHSLNAIKSAMRISQLLDIHLNIGITSGRVFCGPLGSTERREYTILGNAVNLASRLMHNANGRILCDKNIWQAAHYHIEFGIPEYLNLKGVSESVEVYAPYGIKIPEISIEPEKIQSFGRDSELEFMEIQFHHLLEEGVGHTICIAGEQGVGKSLLLRTVVPYAERVGLKLIFTEAEFAGKFNPCNIWSAIGEQLFNLKGIASPEERGETVRKIYQAESPDQIKFLPLLNRILGLEMPLNSGEDALHGIDLMEKFIKLFSIRLESITHDHPLVLIIDNGQWMDSVSWMMINRLTGIRGLLFVIAHRPLVEPYPKEFDLLLRRKDTLRIGLKNLSFNDTMNLIRDRLKIRNNLPRLLQQNIYNKTEGNPYFTEELLNSMIDRGNILITNWEYALSDEWKERSTFDFPRNLEAVIVSKIDRLVPKEQLTLKVASVIGNSFKMSPLSHIYPVNTERTELHTILRSLIRQIMICVDESQKQEEVYYFNQMLVRDVAYNMLLASQKREFHQRLADWYEDIYKNHEGVYQHAILAMHREGAGEKSKAVTHYILAAEDALENGANLEGSEFVERAISLMVDNVELYENDLRSRAHRLLGTARWGLGNLEGAIQELSTVSRLARYRLPSSMAGWIYSLMFELLRLASRRLFSKSFNNIRDLKEKRIIIEAAKATGTMAEIFYFTLDSIRMVASSLISVNLCERLGKEAPVSRPYAFLGYVSGFSGMHKVARYFFKKSRKLSRDLDSFSDLGYAFYAEGVYLMGFGKWIRSRRLLNISHSILLKFSQYNELNVCATLLALNYYYHDGNFKKSLELFEGIRDSASKRFNAQQEAWGYYAAAQNLIILGDYHEAKNRLERSFEILPTIQDRASEVIANGAMGICLLRLGDRAGALKYAERVRALTVNEIPQVFSTLQGYESMAEVYIAHLARAKSEGTSEVIYFDKYAKRSCKKLKLFGRIFLFSQPRAEFYAGLYYLAHGKKVHARNKFLKSLKIAENLDMKYDRARAMEQLALINVTGKESSLMNEAKVLYAQMGIMGT